MTDRAPALVVPTVLLALVLAPATGSAQLVPLAEEVRRFVEGGGALLLPAEERERLREAAAPEREAAYLRFRALDPDPTSAENELAAAVARRRELVLASGLSPQDERGELLFLRGRPAERIVIDCAAAFRPLELWRYGAEAGARTLVVAQPTPGAHFTAWRPSHSKRQLYTPELEYLLEQFEELRGRISGKRPDRLFCDQSEKVDDATGIDGLFGFRRDRIRDSEVEAYFVPPPDLAAWARAVLAEPAPESAPRLPEPELEIGFPEAQNQRLAARIRLTLPAGVELGLAEEGGGREARITVSGALDRADGVFERFQIRFRFAPPAADQPVVLQFHRLLRPREHFVARLEVRDEVSGRQVVFDHGFEVPAEATPEPEPESAMAVVAGQDLALTRLERRDSIVLLPPLDEVVFGLWRAEAIVLGDRIRRVVFLLDGKPLLVRGAPPWSAELRLPTVPQETIVRVEGQDAQGTVVAADEVLLNEPRGEPRVKLLAPPRGRRVSGKVRAVAAVVVPEGKRVEAVEFRLNDALVKSLERPPWEATLEIPAGEELSYLTVVATYADGTRVEDLRVLNSPDFLEEIRVDLVELYVTVMNRDGQPVDGLPATEFEVRDNGRPQQVTKFELVRDLPLTLGLTLDTSGSMNASLIEAKRAAMDFLAAVLTVRDRCFAVGFAERPGLLMPLTSDARALEMAFRDLPAIGSTSLHDALIYSLYQFRGVRGRKAMVLLSDGDDTSSLAAFEDALGFAQRSGVAIYTIGLDIGAASLGIRGKLQKLAEETGGRTFFIEHAGELSGVYEQIERELRSQYLVAFSPDPQPKSGERHVLEVKVSGGKLRARSARGYTP